MGRDLDELARVGRADRQDHGGAAARAQAESSANLASDRQSVAERSASRWGLVLSLQGIIFTVVGSLFVAAFGVSAVGADGPPLPSGGMRPAGVVVIVMSALALAALLLGGSALACRKAFARQRAWVASLPFPLLGYENTLGESYLERASVTVTLAKAPEKASDVVDAAVGLDPRDVEASLDVVTLAIRHRAVAGRGGSTDSPRSPDSNQNHRFRIWMQGPLLELVMALHARYGVTEVTVAKG